MEKKKLSMLRRGTKRKRNKGGMIGKLKPILLLLIVVLCLAVWLVASFRTLVFEQSESGSLHLSSNLHMPLNTKDLKLRDSYSSKQESGALPPYESPTLIFTCSRANYLTDTLQTIHDNISTACSMGCPIVVSQDRDMPDVTKVIQDFKAKFEAKGVPFFHIQHPVAGLLRGNPYQLLAVHYGWALRTLFDGKVYNQYPLPQRVIILEEDLRIAPDFFDYFEATAPYLDKDPTLLAISAFNDNGFQGQVADPKRLLRSDFFPGLGWMMTRNTWLNDLGSKWPNGYWDDWLREPAQRQGRQFIRPEITRTFHFGEKGGASHNQFGTNHNRVMLNTEKVDWKSQDLSYLEPDKFGRMYADMISKAKLVQTKEQALKEVQQGNDARMEYQGGIPGYARLSREIQLMTDEKAGIFRTAYKGVVETRLDGKNFLFLTPPEGELKSNFGGYWPDS